MLTVEVSKTFGSFGLELNFTHDEGTLILFGPSGAGKTTALRLISGLQTPDRGRIVFDGATWFDSKGGVQCPIQRRRLGHIFQHQNLFPHMTGLENIRYAAKKTAPIDQWAALFGIEQVMERFPGRMSGGERQRVAIVRALATEPRLLLMDEPLSAVDAGTRLILLNSLRELNRRTPIPTVYVTHNVSEAFRLGDRVLVMERGAVVRDGVPIDVFHSPNVLSLAGLSGTENIVTGVVERHHLEDGTTDLRVGETVLHVLACESKVGESAMVAIRPEDILIACQEIFHTSARNQLMGTIKRVELDIMPSLLVETPAGMTLRARITHQSMKSLELKAGSRVYMLIKAWACHPIESNDPGESPGHGPHSMA